MSISQRLEAFALQPLAKQLAMTPNRLGFFSRFTFRRLFVGTAQLHLTEDTLALHFLLERLQGLIDIIVAD
jgi:hypothetical protein